jgi:alpha-L-fucosidase 2
VLAILTATALTAPLVRADETTTLLWYRAPAGAWTEALPVGNGRLGAMVFGGPDDERIQLNESTVWSGGPYDPARPDHPEALPEVRRLVFAGRYQEAHDLFGRSLMGRPIEQMKYQPLGDLRLCFPGHGSATDYRRELDLERAVARVRYNVGGVAFTREAFASAADPVIVVRLTAERPGALTFTAQLHGVRNAAHSNYGDDFFRMDGTPPDGLVLRGRSATYLAVPGRVRYEARLQARVEGGQASVEGRELRVTGADAVTLLLAAATNVVNYQDVSANEAARVESHLRGLDDKPYPSLLADHVAAHQRLFARARVDLPAGETSGLPTDERLAKAADGKDPALAALLFNFGRYVLIASSRPGGEPANLQGLWNEDSNPWWDSKYTTNINLEMNYWPAEVANLAETTEPLFRLIREIAVGPGVRAALR